MNRQLISNQPLKDDLEDLDQIDFFQPKDKKTETAHDDHKHQKIERSPQKHEKEPETTKEHHHAELEKHETKKTTTKRYHALQVIDEDTEHFKQKLDGLINSFRTETLNEFMSIKRNLLEDQTNAIDGETRKYSKLLENRTNELDKTKEALAKKIKELERAEVIIHVVSDWAGTARTKKRNALLLSKCFGAFKANKERNETKQRNNHLVDTLHGKRCAAKVFGAWRSHHLNIQKENTRKENDDTLNRELGELAAKYEKEIDLLTNRLNEALIALEDANKNKEEIQENLKKAFMRGVCALNFEAMSILHTKEGKDEDVNLELDGLRKRGGSFSQQDNPFSESLVSTNTDVNNVVEVPHNVSPKKSITVHQNPKLESKEMKWKDAPVVGAAQNSGRKPMAKENNTLRTSTHVEKQQENKENVMHNNLADHSTMSNQSHNEEGRVIKVTQGKSYGMPSPGGATGKQVKSQEKPISVNTNKAALLRTQLAKGKK